MENQWKLIVCRQQMSKSKNNIILIFFKMPKGDKKKSQPCEEHLFSLIPLRSDVYYKNTASLSYCKGQAQPKTRKQHTKPDIQQNCACFPIYNQDRNFATSSFILPEEKKHFVENSEKFKFEHEQRLYDYNDQKTKMLIPKPKSKYSYCSTCKTNYDDYLDHIKSQSHKNYIRKSRITLYIKDIQRKFQSPNRKKQLCQNSKNFDGPSTSNFNDVNIQQMSKPQKRVKNQEDAKEGQQGAVTGNGAAVSTGMGTGMGTVNGSYHMPMPMALSAQNMYYSCPYPFEFYHVYNAMFLGGYCNGFVEFGNSFNVPNMSNMPNMSIPNIPPNMSFLTPPLIPPISQFQPPFRHQFLYQTPPTLPSNLQPYQNVYPTKPMFIDLESVENKN